MCNIMNLPEIGSGGEETCPCVGITNQILRIGGRFLEQKVWIYCDSKGEKGARTFEIAI
jgi:hypothetical protein